MLLPGTFLGVWNLLQISGRESVGIHFACMVTGSRPCTGIRLDWQLYFWHWFLLDSKVARHGEAGIRRSLGVLGNVDNRSGDALGRQYLWVAVAFATSDFGDS